MVSICVLGDIMGSFEDNVFFGTVTVGERGQILVPKKVRDKYDIKPRDSLVIFGRDKKEMIVILKEKVMRDYALKILNDLNNPD